MKTGDQVGGWRITGQQEGSRPDAQGRWVSGVLVSFELPSGQTGSVFVPDARYTAEGVRQAVAARAAVMEEVARLHG